MFQRFCAERADNAKSGKVLFFDQSIHEKLNRSLTIGKKKYDCSFLTDNSEEIQETFVAPPPSAFGLPEGITYKVIRFVYRKMVFGWRKYVVQLFSQAEKVCPVYDNREVW